MKNKKGALAIMNGEVIKVALVILFGLGVWFISSSTKDWVVQVFNLSPWHSLGVGVGIIAIFLLIVKYKPHSFILG